MSVTAMRAEPGALKLLQGLVFGLLAWALALLFFLGITGQFGVVLKGIPLAPPPDDAPSNDVVRWGLAVAATAAVLAASLPWHQRRPFLRGPIPVLLLVATLALALAMQDVVTWALIALPLTVSAGALVVVQLRRRGQRQWKPFAAPLPQLASSALLALGYAVLMGAAIAVS